MKVGQDAGVNIQLTVVILYTTKPFSGGTGIKKYHHCLVSKLLIIQANERDKMHE
jgi:hypothetical protein